MNLLFKPKRENSIFFFFSFSCLRNTKCNKVLTKIERKFSKIIVTLDSKNEIGFSTRFQCASHPPTNKSFGLCANTIFQKKKPQLFHRIDEVKAAQCSFWPFELPSTSEMHERSRCFAVHDSVSHFLDFGFNSMRKASNQSFWCIQTAENKTIILNDPITADP